MTKTNKQDRVTLLADEPEFSSQSRLCVPETLDAPATDQAAALTDDELACLALAKELRAARPSVSLRELHEDWRYQMVSRGWRGGPVRDEVNRLDPCVAAWDNLMPEERAEQAARFGFSFDQE